VRNFRGGSHSSTLHRHTRLLWDLVLIFSFEKTYILQNPSVRPVIHSSWSTWWNEEHFYVDNIRKYFARFSPLSTQDVDGWRPREHVACLFSEDDEEFHNFIWKHMVMPFVLGDFYPGHSEEVAQGKYFALVKPNAESLPMVPLSRMPGVPPLTPMCGE